MGPIACSIKTNNICGLENKISPEKKDNYAIINTKKDDFFSSGMTFSQFYPGFYLKIRFILIIFCFFL